MTQQSSEIQARLQRVFPLREDNVEEFLELVASAVDESGANAIRPILRLASDQCPLAGVMDTMLANLETLEPEVYVPELLDELPEFFARSPFRCSNELRKLLWSPRHRSLLRSCAAALPAETRAVLRRVLADTAAEVPKLRAVAEEMAQQLKTAP